MLPAPLAQAAWKQTVLHGFAGGSDGSRPFGTPIRDSAGNLYGTTYEGGTANDGAVYLLTPPAKGKTVWTETVLYSFAGSTDGSRPQGGLVRDAAGNVYGTTSDFDSGSGTVFELSPPAKGMTVWTKTTLYAFCSLQKCADGAIPYDTLILDRKGNLYGTAAAGGASGAGVVFRLSPPAKGATAWTETVLHSFSGSETFPTGGVVVDKKGNLYGTTQGETNGPYGSVYELTPPASGQTIWTETVLYAFTKGTDGYQPHSGLILGKAGQLYGTTYFGGASGNGTVFEVTPPTGGRTAWTQSVLYSFTGAGDGSGPQAGVVSDKKGNLYGTAQFGQEGNSGTVYELTPPATGKTAWTETTLWVFASATGDDPIAGVTLDAKGNLYGAVEFGGVDNLGTAYELTPK